MVFPGRVSLFSLLVYSTAALAQLPIAFEPVVVANQFVARGPGYTVRLRSDGSVLQAAEGNEFATHLVGANRHAAAQVLDQLLGRSSYFIGADPRQWRTDIPTYARIRFTAIYPGVDLVYSGRQGQLEHDFVVAPGASPAAIRMAFGGDAVIEANGDLRLRQGAISVRHRRPIAYQEAGGVKALVQVSYQRGSADRQGAEGEAR